MLVTLFSIVLLFSYSSADDILCRSCGFNILKSDEIIPKISLASVFQVNDTLFGKKDVVVQVLRRDLLFQFPIITSIQSSCVGFGEWEEEELWFPGYSWKPCLCPECGVLVGWIFKNHNSQDSDYFFALILPNLLDKEYLQSIIIHPE